MTPLLISLPDWARERLRQIAEQEGVGMNELIEKWIVERTGVEFEGDADELLAYLNAADGLVVMLCTKCRYSFTSDKDECPHCHYMALRIL